MSLTFIPPQRDPAAFRAGWVMTSPDRIEQNTCLETAGYRVAGISKRPSAAKIRDLGPGLVMPLLVNAHTHLELSALKGKLDPSKGFEAWVKDLLIQRQQLDRDTLAAAARQEILRLHDTGTGAVAEISTLGLTRDILAQNHVPGVWFLEVLGTELDPAAARIPENNPGQGNELPGPGACLSFSLAGHAPHTTSPDLLKRARAATQAKGLPFSIHLAESAAESDFIRGENQGWTEFLLSRGIDPGSWPVGDKTPVAYLDALGLLGPDTLGVHLINTETRDLERLSQTGTRVCLCPRSNFNLHGRLPDLPAMLNRGIAPALGTDSLASCDSLSLFDEMAFVRTRWPSLAPETVLAMAGMNGARALGLACGAFEKGYWAGCLYVDMEADSCDTILERLTTYEF